MISREHYLTKIQAGFQYNPIVVLIGARQVGKTTLMEMYVKEKQNLWLNGQNPETAQFFEKFSTIERYLKININEELNGLLVIDEFQYVNDISLILKLFVDKYKNLRILCSGSSSLEIVQKVEESLAGRIRLINVYSLSFSEFVKFQNSELSENFNKCKFDDNINILFPQLPILLNEYLLYGGLPKVALAGDFAEKEELLSDIFKTYLLKDVRQYIKNQDFVAFNKLLKILAAQTGNLLNINEISNTIQLAYKTCEEYINILEQMFIIQLINPFTSNLRKEITKRKKIFFYDLGLRNIIYNSFNDIYIRTDNGQIFENYVFLQLLQDYKQSQICFYRTKDATEIDFIISEKNNKIIPIEVKFKEFKNHKKIRAISEFSKNVEIEKSYIINRNLIENNEDQFYMQPYVLHL
ncbi:MAG: ATP-binding protein [Bacteroidales bacterium]|nr:ATP-binding protein [Bacteroidales bacterium]